MMFRKAAAASALVVSLALVSAPVRAEVSPWCDDAYSYCLWAYGPVCVNNCDPNDEECIDICRNDYYGCMVGYGCYDPINYPFLW